MRRAALLAAFVVLLAGCSDGGGDAPGGDGDASSTATGTSGGMQPGNGTEVVAAPPLWATGTSWRWTLRSGALAQEQTVTTTVIAADGGQYDVGVNAFAAAAGVYPFHLVPIGPVDAATLAWQAHGSPVNFIRFPLRDGDTFTTDLWSAPGAIVVVEAANVTTPSGGMPGFRSTASYANGGTFAQADYAPAVGQFVRIASYFGAEQPFAEATLDGEVDPPEAATPFRASDVARYNANAGDPPSLAPRPVNIPAGTETVLLACFVPSSPGYGAELTTAGAPSVCASSGSGTGTQLSWGYAGASPGPGTVTGLVGGADGGTTVEVFAVDTS